MCTGTCAARPCAKGDAVRRVIAEEKEDTSLLSRLETAQFAEDFGLCPGLLRRMDVMYAFKHSDRPDYGPNAPHNREDQLNFDEFVGFLVQCAILGYDHPRHRKDVPDDIAAVDAVLVGGGVSHTRGDFSFHRSEAVESVIDESLIANIASLH